MVYKEIGEVTLIKRGPGRQKENGKVQPHGVKIWSFYFGISFYQYNPNMLIDKAILIYNHYQSITYYNV